MYFKIYSVCIIYIYTHIYIIWEIAIGYLLAQGEGVGSDAQQRGAQRLWCIPLNTFRTLTPWKICRALVVGRQWLPTVDHRTGGGSWWIMVPTFRNVQDILVCLYEKLFPHRTGIARSRLEPWSMVGLCWIYGKHSINASCELDFLMGKPNFVDGWELFDNFVGHGFGDGTLRFFTT